jgi:hypothetical protein
MNPQADYPQSADSQATQPTAGARKRFHVEKLEERIAPAAHYNPHSKLVGGGGGDGGSSNSGSNDSTSGGTGY